MLGEKFGWIAGKLIDAFKENFPALSPDEQIRFSWLRLIRSADEVPDVYRSVFEDLVGDRQFPYTVLTPSYAGFIHKESEKLVFCLDDRVCELAVLAGDLKCTYHSIEAITLIEEGRALLHSWVKICSLTENGEAICTEYKFNTVSEQIFAPIIKKMRIREGWVDQPRGKFNFDSLFPDHMKLINYTRRSLLPGEEVLDVILQPELRKKIFSLFGRSFFRFQSLAHISILTDRELIHIQEGVDGRKGDRVRYGGVYHYIFLEQITGVEASLPQDSQLTLSVCLTDGTKLEYLFSGSKQQEVNDLISRYNALLGY